MLTNININKMNQLTSENETAKQIVSQLLENHQTIVSMISHEIRNPLTLVSSALQIIEIQHPEVINFHGWSQAIEDIEFMCNLLNELSDFNNGSTLHHSVFSLEKLLKNIAVSFAMSLDSINSNIEFTSKISLNSDNYTGDKIKFEEVILNNLFFPTIPLFTYTKCEFCIFFSFFTFSLQNLNLYHSPHTSPLKYKNSLSHLNTGRSYAFPSLYKMQKESFHMLYYFRFFFINNKSLNSSKAISFPALFKRTTSNTSE